MWYVGDIACAVNTCITLHNLIVSHQIDTNELELEAHYAYDQCVVNDEQTPWHHQQQVLKQKNSTWTGRWQRWSCVSKQLYEINRGDFHLSYQQNAIIDSLFNSSMCSSNGGSVYTMQRNTIDWKMHVWMSFLRFSRTTAMDTRSRVFVVMCWQEQQLQLP